MDNQLRLSQTAPRRVQPVIVATIADTWMTTVDRQDAPPSPLLAPQDEVIRLFSEQGSVIFRFCRSMLRTSEEAEDVVQDTFLKLLRHLEAAGDRGNLRAWLFTVAAPRAAHTRI